MAAAKSSVKRRLPLANPLAKSPSSPGSWKGAAPDMSSDNLSGSASTPMTSFPTWARQPATTDPT